MACYESCSGYCGVTCGSAVCTDTCANGCQDHCAYSCSTDGCKTSWSGGCGNTCTGTCKTTCADGCADDCTATCADDCVGTCTANCANDCSTSCLESCANSCENTCNSGCQNGCQSACDNGCTAQNNSELYSKLALDVWHKQENLQTMATLAYNEAVRRGASPDGLTFTVGEKLTAIKINELIALVRLSGQNTSELNAVKNELSLRSLGQSLVDKIKAAYEQILS